MDQCAMLLRTSNFIMPGKETVYLNMQWDILPGWVSYFALLCEGKLLNLCCPAADWTRWKTLYLKWNIYHWKKGKKWVLVWYILPNPSPYTWPWYLLWATFMKYSSVRFNRSVMSDSLRPHGVQHARPPCPPPTPGVYSNSCSSSRWCHPTISSSVIPFSSCLQSFSASGSFQISLFFT